MAKEYGVSVLDFGVKGGGVADGFHAFRAALDFGEAKVVISLGQS